MITCLTTPNIEKMSNTDPLVLTGKDFTKKVGLNEWVHFGTKFSDRMKPTYNMDYTELKTFNDHILEFKSEDDNQKKHVVEVEFVNHIGNLTKFFRENSDIGGKYGIKFNDDDNQNRKFFVKVKV